MKKRAPWWIGLLLAMGTTCSLGVTRLEVHAKIPFAFTVNRNLLPAGEYTIMSLGSSDGNTLLIRSSDGLAMVMVRTHSVKARRTPDERKLEFLVYGDQHVLRAMWLTGDDSGYELPVNTKAVVARKSGSPEHVAVAARAGGMR